MESSRWLELCYRALDIPDTLPEQERRRRAEHILLEQTGQRVDILGLGAAEAAIDLVVRYGEAGELGQVMLRWEQAEMLSPEITAAGLGDEGTQRATACAKALLAAVVRCIEAESAGSGDGGPLPG